MTRRINESWLTAKAPQALCALLARAGYQAWFVGGCVRNALLGAPITDIDITTDANPQTVTDLAKNAGFHPVPTGFEHGTVTVVVEGEPFEVTTFRRDLETDGRRATVAFAQSIEEDAHRRDFTMNALYADPTGEIADPLGGLPDLEERRVRFIDDAAGRIREDYLRILRFFRFHAWYGNAEAGLDPEGLAAAAHLADGLEALSRERVGAEMKKLFAAPNPAPSVAAMAQSGVLARVLPGADATALPILIHFEQASGIVPNPLRRLACLGGADHMDRLRLSKDEARYLDLLLDQRGTAAGPGELGYRFGRDAGIDIGLLRAAALEQPLPETFQAELRRGETAKFPVRPRDLMPKVQGAALGQKLRKLEDRWIASGFTLPREELLKEA